MPIVTKIRKDKNPTNQRKTTMKRENQNVVKSEDKGIPTPGKIKNKVTKV